MLGDKGFEPMNTVIIIRKLNQIQSINKLIACNEFLIENLFNFL